MYFHPTSNQKSFSVPKITPTLLDGCWNLMIIRSHPSHRTWMRIVTAPKKHLSQGILDSYSHLSRWRYTFNNVHQGVWDEMETSASSSRLEVSCLGQFSVPAFCWFKQLWITLVLQCHLNWAVRTNRCITIEEMNGETSNLFSWSSKFYEILPQIVTFKTVDRYLFLHCKWRSSIVWFSLQCHFYIQAHTARKQVAIDARRILTVHVYPSKRMISGTILF